MEEEEVWFGCRWKHQGWHPASKRERDSDKRNKERERERREVIGGWQGVLQTKARVPVSMLATTRANEAVMAASVIAD